MFSPPFATVHWSGNPEWVNKAANIDLPGLLGFRQRVNRVYVAQNYVKCERSDDLWTVAPPM
eukprot:3580399-Amphidinium_carterae.1